MKPCSICRDTSPDDAAFCITCGCAFGAVGATERMSSAGQQTQRLSDSGPSSIASAAPVGFRTVDEVRSDMGPSPLGGVEGAGLSSSGTPYRIVYVRGIVGMGSVYLGQPDFGHIGFGSAPVIIVKE